MPGSGSDTVQPTIATPARSEHEDRSEPMASTAPGTPLETPMSPGSWDNDSLTEFSDDETGFELIEGSDSEL
jgi:hypothetical protein